MDPALQNHGFGDLGQSQEPSGAPVGVDEAEMILSSEPGSTGSQIADNNSNGFQRATRNDLFGLPAQPGLRRDKSVPGPHQPPPPAPPQPLAQPGSEDSLSLMQLKSLVRELPKVEPTPYAFVYRDSSILPDELEEWFTYSAEERECILKTRATFAEAWSRFNGGDGDVAAYLAGRIDFTQQAPSRREDFINHLLEGISSLSLEERTRRLEALTFVICGCWHETAGVQDLGDDESLRNDENGESDPLKEWRASHKYSALQLQRIQDNSRLLLNSGRLQAIFESLQNACDRICSSRAGGEEKSPSIRHVERSEFWCASTILYFLIEVVRCSQDEQTRKLGRRQFLELHPMVLVYLSGIMDKIRWDDSIDIPLTKLLLLYWKAVLLSFGATPELKAVKASFIDPAEETSDTKGFPIITASPLDYHVFRQEISSKYPAYSPPPPLFPLEPENMSILPPLKPTLQRLSDTAPGLGSLQGHSSSILHQPVHIATPAPSPPPSPSVGGKGGKKQNYQTNQMFPFLYPPLDASSNRLGGMGSTELQDALVGRKWEGSDIPASILEAAELFSKRMRATRAMKQLWEERVEFMKYERGWKAPADDSDVESIVAIDSESAGETKASKQQPETREHDGSVEDRLDVVELFYRNTLPHLQSVVMVLVKVVLSHVTALVTQMNNQNGLQSGFQFQETQNGDGPHKGDGPNGVNGAHNGSMPITTDELDMSRSQEITAKAVSGTLIMLLKWFKVSHILKFEYLTQLLVDASYIPMVLKLLQSQEIERLVNFKCDSEESSFFHICRANSRAGIPDPSPVQPDEAPIMDESSSEDEACPPPIKRHREPPTTDPPPPPTSAPPAPPTAQNVANAAANAQTQPSASGLPEVDELGIPTTALPAAPITNFSQRNFFAAITSLRVLRAVCGRHAHRNLMLVQYKSTPVLRRILRVPQSELRKYALKLVKAQVPFCGRKWRQANMRVITAVWLSIRPELRDDWLSGGDVDTTVEESVPREQAIRGLVHWWHLRRYWDVVGPPGTPGLGVAGLDDGGGANENELGLGEEEVRLDGEGRDDEESGNKASRRSKSREERRRWLEEENDFFRRELEKMEWDWASEADSLENPGDAAGQGHGHMWDGIQMEGW